MAKLDSKSTPEHTQAGNSNLDHEAGSQSKATGLKDSKGQEGSAPCGA